MREASRHGTRVDWSLQLRERAEEADDLHDLRTVGAELDEVEPVSLLRLLHTIHHRGQLSTYLRPMGGKVPSIYGGSADEPMPM